MKIVIGDEAVKVWDVHAECPVLQDKMWYRAILPTGERFPVLFFLHGANSNPCELTDRSHIVRLAIAERLAVVMPYGGFSYYTNAKHSRHARWEDVITSWLPHDVSSRFSTETYEGRFGIAGISMGGYAAIKLALKHSDLFRFSGCLSGPLDISRRKLSLRRMSELIRVWKIFGLRRKSRLDEDVLEILKNSKCLSTVTWFLACGEKDSFYKYSREFVDTMREKGVEISLHTNGGGHDWSSWNEALPILFRIAGIALH
jgi:putative tributyrin esterase